MLLENGAGLFRPELRGGGRPPSPLAFPPCRRQQREGAAAPSAGSMQSLVSCQGRAEAEGFATFGTDVPLLRSPLRVGTLVPVAVGAAAEAFAAVGTGEGFLTGVGEPVPVVVGAPGKTFAADATLVGFLAPVKPPVPLQAGRRAKTLATLGAGVGPARLGGMGAAMSQQGGTDGKALPTLTAAVGPLAGVHPAMPFQVGADSKGSPAFPAAERLLPGVDAAMALQVRDPTKTLPACPTWVGFAASSGTSFLGGCCHGFGSVTDLLLPGMGALVLGQG